MKNQNVRVVSPLFGGKPPEPMLVLTFVGQIGIHCFGSG
jgi:hypothetical protein